MSDLGRLRELLAKAASWRCTRDVMRCMDGNGCECEMAGDPDLREVLATAAINALPRLLAIAEAWERAPSAYVNRVYDCELQAYGGEIHQTLPVELVNRRVRLVAVEGESE